MLNFLHPEVCDSLHLGSQRPLCAPSPEVDLKIAPQDSMEIRDIVELMTILTVA